jgi:signal transduction histidine kinase
MTPPGAFWLGLSAVATFWAMAMGVPLWLSATAFFCAVLPSLVGMFMRGSASAALATEVESALWITLATAGAASTGGATSVIILFGVAIAVAWMSGRVRLTLEIASFALGGMVVAIIAGSGGSWMHPLDAAVLATGYGVAGLVMLAALAGFAALQRPRAVVAAGKSAASDARLHQLEQQLRSTAAAADEARAKADKARTQLEARTTFFAQTSHELRTPLNAIVGFADMMRGAVFGPLPERYQEYAELIHEGGQNLTLIVDDVLDLARLEAGKYDIVAEPVSLSDLADDAVHFMADEATRKKIDLRRTGQEDAEAFADAKAVRQIALNLISNALKFTPAGGVVDVVAEEVAGGSLLSVADSGVGISPDDLMKLSRAFEQGEAGKKQKGAGLGLSVVRAFAELHGGRLEIESREGGGTRIGVFFPAEASDVAAAKP